MADMETFAAFDDAFAKDKVYEAERLADEIERLGERSAEGRKALEARAKNVARIREDVRLLDKLLKEIKGDEGWKFATQSKGTTIHFKQPEGSPFIMTKVKSYVDALPGKTLPETFVALCSHFAETDLMPKWFPRGIMSAHDTLLEETAFSRFTRIRIKVPVFLPVSNRETIIHGKGYDMTERSALAISYKTLPEDFHHDDFTVPEPTKAYTRIHIEGAYYMEILPDGRMLFEQLQMLDLKLKLVPPFILNALSKGKLPLEFNNNLNKRLRDFDNSEWDMRCRAQPELYEDIQHRLEDYLASQGLGPPRGKGKAEETAPQPAEEPEPAAQLADNSPQAEPARTDEPEGGFESTLRTWLSYVVSEETAARLAGQVSDLFGASRSAPVASVEEARRRSSKRPSIRESLRASLRRPTAPSVPQVEPLKSASASASASSKVRLSKRLSRAFGRRRRGKR